MLHPSGIPAALQNLDRSLIFGVLNVTPDSFSDGGEFATTSSALAQGRKLATEGADVIDVGGESTRPGAQRISIDEELARVIPVVETLVADGLYVSVDTMRAPVAAAALTAGAHFINDVSGGKADADMYSVLAASSVPYIQMHWRGHSDVMNELTTYTDVAADVANELSEVVTNAVNAGINRSRLVLDPGIGFAKTTQQNWPLLANLDVVDALGLPLLVGVSRKRFLGELLKDDQAELRPTQLREHATTAFTTILALRNTWAIRVHDAQAAADAVRVVERLRVER